MDRQWSQKDRQMRPKEDHKRRRRGVLPNRLQSSATDIKHRHSPTTCCMMTLIVRRGMSPQGTLLVARARHSLGGTDCKKCSMAGNNSTGSSFCSSRSCGIPRASFHMHFSTSSATFASLESGAVPLLGKGFTTCSNNTKSDLCKLIKICSMLSEEGLT